MNWAEKFFNGGIKLRFDQHRWVNNFLNNVKSFSFLFKKSNQKEYESNQAEWYHSFVNFVFCTEKNDLKKIEFLKIEFNSPTILIKKNLTIKNIMNKIHSLTINLPLWLLEMLFPSFNRLHNVFFIDWKGNIIGIVVFVFGEEDYGVVSLGDF